MGLLQATQYFLFKCDQHDQCNVLNLLTYNFGIKDNFEQGGIVPLKEIVHLRKMLSLILTLQFFIVL